MPDDRFFHKCAGHSEKVNSLTDFEELIWRYYILSADDFGVMKFSPDQLRADHERAAGKPIKMVQRALDRIVAVGLVHRFDHQGRAYIYSRNWQEYQKVGYPRDTINPVPPVVELAECEGDTLALFGSHPGGKRGKEIRKLVSDGIDIRSARRRVLGSESVGEPFPLVRARALALAVAEAVAEAPEGGAGETAAPPVERVQRFIDRYRDLHEQYIGVAYLGNPQKDYWAACELVAAFDDALLEKIAVFGLNDQDAFMCNGTRTLTKLKSRASDYAATLKAKRLA